MPTEMGEGREPGVGQGSVDEGGGLTFHPHHPENLPRMSSSNNLLLHIYTYMMECMSNTITFGLGFSYATLESLNRSQESLKFRKELGLPEAEYFFSRC